MEKDSDKCFLTDNDRDTWEYSITAQISPSKEMHFEKDVYILQRNC